MCNCAHVFGTWSEFGLFEQFRGDLELSGHFPGELLVSEVAILSGRLVDRSLQVEISARRFFARGIQFSFSLLDDFAWSQVEVIVDDLKELLLVESRRAEREDHDGQGLGDANRIGHLHEAASADACLHQRLGYPSSGVSSRSIHL